MLVHSGPALSDCSDWSPVVSRANKKPACEGDCPDWSPYSFAANNKPPYISVPAKQGEEG